MRAFLQQVFNAYTGGAVYKFMGTVPEGQEATHYISERFTAATGNNLLTTCVSDLGPSKGILIYVEEGAVIKAHQEFALMEDLTPEPVAWSPAPEPTPEESTPPQEGQ